MMQPQYIKITIFDQTTKKARLFSIPNNMKLSQLRQLIQKQWQVKQFKFINDGYPCSKSTQKHTPVTMYMKAYNLITIMTQIRQQPKKQSKIIQKQSKRLIQSSSIAQRHIANTREFLQKQRLHQQKQRIHQQKMAMLNNNIINMSDNKSGLIVPKRSSTTVTDTADDDDIIQKIDTLTQQQQLVPASNITTTNNHFKWTRQNIEYCQLKYGIELSQNGQGIDYDYNNTINIQELTKFNWPNVEWLGLYGCGIDDNKWRLLVDRACVFAQLKVLGLKDNNIKTIKQGDLQNFKSLKMVQFGTQDGCNPLSEQSIQYLKRFKQQNRHIRVKFRY